MPNNLALVIGLGEIYMASATNLNNILIEALQDTRNLVELARILPELHQIITLQETLYEHLISIVNHLDQTNSRFYEPFNEFFENLRVVTNQIVERSRDIERALNLPLSERMPILD